VIPTEIRALPVYALYSLARMACAYVLALGFSIVYGYIAATNRRAERIMMPLLDILQSVPVLGFFPRGSFSFSSISPAARDSASKWRRCS